MTRFQNRRAWLTGLIAGLTSLGLAAVLLWLALPLVLSERGSDRRHVDPITLSAGDFSAAPAAPWLAAVDERSDALAGGRVRMIPRASLGLQAENYPQLALSLDSVSTDALVYLFWRTVEAPEAVSFAELEPMGRGMNWFGLSAEDGWVGAVSEVAVATRGGPGRPAPELSELSFYPSSRSTLIKRAWSEWTRFEPWRMSSVNRYPGARGEVFVRPAAAFSVWVALALAILLVGAWRCQVTRQALVCAMLVVLLVPWVGLDRLWQSQLQHQVQATRDRFGGLTQASKHGREMDADLQRYAARIRDKIPAAADQRLFILHESRGHNYWRLRLQFHLLPMNIYNFGHRLLPAGEMRPGDYVLVLDPIDGLQFEAECGVLADAEQQWSAVRVDRHPFGRLYRLAERARAQCPEASG